MKNIEFNLMNATENHTIPTLQINVMSDGNVLKSFYLTPYRRYGFQVTINMDGDCAIGVICGSIKGVVEASGMYQHETFASLAFAGFSEWWERCNHIEGAEKPEFRLFNRETILTYSSDLEKHNHEQVQAWIDESFKWLNIEPWKF